MILLLHYYLGMETLEYPYDPYHHASAWQWRSDDHQSRQSFLSFAEFSHLGVGRLAQKINL